MVEKLNKEQIKLLKNAFDSFDREKKGSINPSMVGTILEMLGQTLDDKTLRKVQLEADEDGSGELDFDEFAALAAKYIDVEEEVDVPVKDLKEVFRFYDKEGKGYLSLDTLKAILKDIDDKMTKDDLQEIVEEIDADGSGTVDFQEFVQIMTG